jgi:hypothetical protein
LAACQCSAAQIGTAIPTNGTSLSQLPAGQALPTLPIKIELPLASSTSTIPPANNGFAPGGSVMIDFAAGTLFARRLARRAG